MQYTIPFALNAYSEKIQPSDAILLMGSCFTEHIGGRFHKYGWNVLENPNGTIFNTESIYKAIERYVHNKHVNESDFFLHNELWSHWEFHTSFSHIDRSIACKTINASIQQSHDFLKKADWVILTLGSSFQYILKENALGVANCHRVPIKQFDKKLLSIEENYSHLKNAIRLLKANNPSIKVMITVSPVRHIKDGVVENNRSKARLIEATQMLVDEELATYFPSYEILIDVLRDYRFYDADMVHPNYQATQTVWEYIVEHILDPESKIFLKKMIDIHDAFQHRTRFPDTEAHRKFLNTYHNKCIQLQKEYPFVDLQKHIYYFSNIEK